MDRKFLWVILGAVMVLVAGQAGALAAESGLGGVKLDQQAVDLLKDPTLGQPQYVGPAGATVALTTVETQTAASRRQAAARPASVGGAAPSYGALAPAARRAVPAGQEKMLYWLYARGEHLVVGIRPDGTVASVQVSGGFGRSSTARGITLGSAYTRVFSVYGYPDETVHVGTMLVVRYLDHGLTLMLTNRTVTSILLESVPSELVAPRAPRRPGLPAVEEGDDDDDDDDDE